MSLINCLLNILFGLGLISYMLLFNNFSFLTLLIADVGLICGILGMLGELKMEGTPL